MLSDLSQLSFEESYFESEIRDGFQIMELMKRAWAAQLEILSTIDRFCRRYDITWYAHFGTLLGAVRHKGFIPWDDDIDIVMKREDYMRFLSLASKDPDINILLYSVVLGNYTDSLSNCFFTRIINSENIWFNDEFLKQYHYFPYTAGVDLFPLDGVPDNEDEKSLLYELIRFTLETELEIDNMDTSSRSSRLAEIEEYCGITFNKSKDIHSQLLSLVDALAQSYSIDECTTLAPVGWYAGKEIYCSHPKDYYSQPQKLPFENTYMNVPENYSEILSNLYGHNYMTPVMNAQSHTYPFWKNQKITAHKIAGHEGWEARERYVADQLHIHEDELLEIQPITDQPDKKTYLYFCQHDLVKVNIPDKLWL